MGKYMSKTDDIYKTMLVYRQYKNYNQKNLSTDKVLKQMFFDLTLLAEEYAIDFDYKEIEKNSVIDKENNNE